MTAARQLWRFDDPVLDAEGNVVTGGMWQHQRSWWGLPQFMKVLVGGYGCGKTLITCKRSIATALYNGPVPSMIVAPTYRMLADTSLETLLELLDARVGKKGWHDFAYNFAKSKMTIELRLGRRWGRILLRSGEDPTKLKGTNIGCAYIDEPFMQDRAVLDALIARCRHPQAMLREIGATGTPEQLNWGHDLCEGELGRKLGVGVVRASTRDNKALRPEYVDRMVAGYDEKMVRAFVDGQFVNLTEGMIYHRYDPSTVCLDTDPEWARHGGSGQPFAGIDFNVDPMALVRGYRQGDHLHIEDERELPNSGTPEAAREIKRDWSDVVEVYPDPTCRARKTSGVKGTDYQQLQDAGFDVLAPHRPWARRDRFASVNERMREGKLTIGPKCRKLRSALAKMSYALESKEEGKRLSHILDAFGYPVIYQFPVGGTDHIHESAA